MNVFEYVKVCEKRQWMVRWSTNNKKGQRLEYHELNREVVANGNKFEGKLLKRKSKRKIDDEEKKDKNKPFQDGPLLEGSSLARVDDVALVQDVIAHGAKRRNRDVGHLKIHEK